MKAEIPVEKLGSLPGAVAVGFGETPAPAGLRGLRALS